MSREEINDIKEERDCGKCVWRSEHGCTVWDCDYISRQTLHAWLEEHPEMKEIRNG